jgi:hypothetical protein
MAQQIQLEISIDPEGNLRIETHGLKGAECLVETESIERALGEVVERTKTREYYAHEVKARARSSQRR